MIEADVWHYDGGNANRWRPQLVGTAEQFRLIGPGWEAGPYHWADLVALDNAGQDAAFGHRSHQGWRIGFDGPVPADIAPLLPRRQRYGGIIDRHGLAKVSVLFACLAGAAIFVGVKAPGWIAPFVPQSWEDRMGDAMIGDFGGRICHTKEGDAALAALVAKLDPDRHARSIEVANIPMVNAVALPGRHVIIFDGLLASAQSPDEVAGVLGHEVGHVKHRDTLTAMMRQMGLSVILGGMDGAGGAQVSGLLGLSFSRDAEHQADLASIDTLRRANISPLSTAEFFDRMTKAPASPDEKGEAKPKGEKPAQPSSIQKIEEATSWLASHPTSKSRHDLFVKAAEKDRAYAPALTAQQWQALRDMCSKDRKVEKGFGLKL